MLRNDALGMDWVCFLSDVLLRVEARKRLKAVAPEVYSRYLQRF